MHSKHIITRSWLPYHFFCPDNTRLNSCRPKVYFITTMQVPMLALVSTEKRVKKAVSFEIINMIEEEDGHTGRENSNLWEPDGSSIGEAGGERSARDDMVLVFLFFASCLGKKVRLRISCLVRKLRGSLKY